MLEKNNFLLLNPSDGKAGVRCCSVGNNPQPSVNRRVLAKEAWKYLKQRWRLDTNPKQNTTSTRAAEGSTADTAGNSHLHTHYHQTKSVILERH